MPRYIDAENVIERIKADMFLSQHDRETAEFIVMTSLERDVQEVRHGKWIIRDGSRAFQYYDGKVSYEDCCCSRCGKWGYSDMKYCPHCGARMDGE